MLPEGTLSNDSWGCLVNRAQVVGNNGVLAAPPSAQQSTVTSLLEHRKRRTSPLLPHPSKRTRVEAADVLAASPSLSDDDEVPEAQLAERITTITNHNQRAERERSKKLKLSRNKKRLKLSLVIPEYKASAQERAAYNSILQHNKPTIA
jgi:hypothetical protein